MWLNNDGNWENVPVDSLYGMGIYNQDFILVKENSDIDLDSHHAYSMYQVFDSDSQTIQRSEWIYFLTSNNVKSSGMITAGFYLIVKKYREEKQEESIFTNVEKEMVKEIIVNSDDIERSEFLKNLLQAIIQASSNLDDYTLGYIREYFPDLILE